MTTGTDETISNEAIVKEIQAGDNKRLADLYHKNYRLIWSIAKDYADISELEDLIQEGFLGLREAAKRYDPSHGAKFSTYASAWIRQSVIRYINQYGKAIRLPEFRQNQVRRYKRFISQYYTGSGEMPTDKTICDALAIYPEDLQKIKRAAEIDTVSISTPIGEDGELGDTLQDEYDAIEEAENRIQNEQLEIELWSAVDELPEDLKRSIHMRYRNGYTYGEIARQTKKTEIEAQCTHDKAIRKLRKSRHSKKLRQFLYEDVYREGLKGTGNTHFQITWTSSTERAAMIMLRKKIVQACAQ